MSDENPVPGASPTHDFSRLAGQFTDVLNSFARLIGEIFQHVGVLEAVLMERGVITEEELRTKFQVLKDVAKLGRDLEKPKPE